MDAKQREEECLDRCLNGLSEGERDLVMKYFQGEKHAKIRQRSKLIQELQISPNALRLRIHRITTSLRGCVFECLDAERRSAMVSVKLSR
jgi:hypothetical protein